MSLHLSPKRKATNTIITPHSTRDFYFFGGNHFLQNVSYFLIFIEGGGAGRAINAGKDAEMISLKINWNFLHLFGVYAGKIFGGFRWYNFWRIQPGFVLKWICRSSRTPRAMLPGWPSRSSLRVDLTGLQVGLTFDDPVDMAMGKSLKLMGINMAKSSRSENLREGSQVWWNRSLFSSLKSPRMGVFFLFSYGKNHGDARWTLRLGAGGMPRVSALSGLWRCPN